jgi:hypothetical protein
MINPVTIRLVWGALCVLGAIGYFSEAAAISKNKRQKLTTRINNAPEPEPEPEPKAAPEPEPKAAPEPEPKAAPEPEPKAD